MLNKLSEFAHRYNMLAEGDSVVCAVSGGADSMALLWAMYLLRDTLGIQVSAAHFNHRLRGAESDRDEAFVRDFCRGYRIPLTCGSAQVCAGKKGLEAAARDARYDFLQQLPGKIATAHTANDNAETLLMHLVRGTGLRGLGGISPVRGNLIRPMLTITRSEVLEFLGEYSIPYVCDSSNDTQQFLRNRIRHDVMPLLERENPSLAQNLSATALRLRLDEQALDSAAVPTPRVDALRKMDSAVRSRTLGKLLKNWGVREPEAEHIALLEQLVFSAKPSAQASFPWGVQVRRSYDCLEKVVPTPEIPRTKLNCPGVTRLPGLNIHVTPAKEPIWEPNRFTVHGEGAMVVRSRLSGDKLRLSGGTKTLKELFIDRKIPAARRNAVAVIADERGVLGVQGIGANRDRTDHPNWEVLFEIV